MNRFADLAVSQELDRRGEPYVIDFEAHVPIPAEMRRAGKEARDDIDRWVFDALKRTYQVTEARLVADGCTLRRAS